MVTRISKADSRWNSRRNYRNIKKKAKSISDMKNAEAVASKFFLDPRRFWKEFKDAPEKCPISDITKWTHYLRVWLAHQVQTLMR